MGQMKARREPCRPVSRVLYPPKADGDHLSSLPNDRRATELPRWAGRCYHRGRAANPGTGRAPIVPLFGLAPGGVWPSLRHRRRPDALTVRFHPCPPLADGMFLCHFPSSAAAPTYRCATAEAWVLPSTLPGGARTFLPDHPDKSEAPRRSPGLPGSPPHSSTGPYGGQD